MLFIISTRWENFTCVLNPDIVLVRYDKQGIPRALLLDLGLGDTGQTISQIWNDNYNLPAYTAPEIADKSGKVGPATDVYGLGNAAL